MAVGGTSSPTVPNHTQYVRLAWSIDAGHPVEKSSSVAEHYAGLRSLLSDCPVAVLLGYENCRVDRTSREGKREKHG